MTLYISTGSLREVLEKPGGLPRPEPREQDQRHAAEYQQRGNDTCQHGAQGSGPAAGGEGMRAIGRQCVHSHEHHHERHPKRHGHGAESRHPPGVGSVWLFFLVVFAGNHGAPLRLEVMKKSVGVFHKYAEDAHRMHAIAMPKSMPRY